MILGYVNKTDLTRRTIYISNLSCFKRLFSQLHNSSIPSHSTSPQPSVFPVSTYKDELQRECCLDGMRETPLSYTCERRSEYILDGAACIQAFLHCCKEMETQQAERKEENLRLARSKRQGQGLRTKAGVVMPGYIGSYKKIKVVTFYVTF